MEQYNYDQQPQYRHGGARKVADIIELPPRGRRGAPRYLGERGAMRGQQMAPKRGYLIQQAAPRGRGRGAPRPQEQHEHHQPPRDEPVRGRGMPGRGRVMQAGPARARGGIRGRGRGRGAVQD
jgi:hypothetical protein